MLATLLAALGLALGLAMDATAVAAVQGLAGRETRRGLRLALLFGGFQAGMAALGWLGGRTLGDTFAAWDHWLAFGLLLLLGAKMLWEARGGDDHDDGLGDKPRPQAPWRLDLTLAVATSIDALAAGVTLPLVAPPALALVAIGVVTALASLTAYAFAMRLGSRTGARLNALGGVVLIAMGTKILIEHLRAAPEPPARPAITAHPSPAADVAVPAPVAGPAGRALDADTLAAVAALRPPGVEVRVRATTADLVDLEWRWSAEPTLRADIELSRCLGCVPLTEDAWQLRADALRTLVLPPSLRPDATVALAIRGGTVATWPVIYVSHDADRLVGDVPVASHGLLAATHDGQRQLRVRVYDDVAPVRAGSAVSSAPRPAAVRQGLADAALAAIVAVL